MTWRSAAASSSLHAAHRADALLIGCARMVTAVKGVGGWRVNCRCKCDLPALRHIRGPRTQHQLEARPQRPGKPASATP